MKKLLIICVCLLTISMFSGCIGFDEKLISQKEAQKIAEGLTGGEVTYVDMEEKDGKEITYNFTDSRGITFSVITSLSRGDIDGAEFGPYNCHVTDDYCDSVFAHYRDEVDKILEKYGLTEHIKYIGDSYHCINLKIYCETPEKNHEMLEKIASAGAEIDSLLNITYDAAYKEKTKKKYYTYSNPNNKLSLLVDFYKKFDNNNSNKDEMIYDITSPEFSASDDERWTAESLYEAMKAELEKVELPQ